MSEAENNETQGAIPKTNKQKGKQPFKPKHMNYASYEDRLHTFQNWPVDAGHDKRELATMGFCYEERNKQIYCFCCGCEFSNIHPEEDLWIKHAYIAPECVYLQNQKGKDYIDDIRSKMYFNRAPSPITENQTPCKTTTDFIIIRPLDCKLCYERQVKILFLPCSHLVMCAHCAMRVNDCCICRQPIEFMVRVTLPREQNF